LKYLKYHLGKEYYYRNQ